MVHRMILLIVGLLLPVGGATALGVGPNVMIVLEAADLALTAPMQAASDMDALGEKYIIVPRGAGQNGSASTRVQLPAAGDYYVWGRVKAPMGAGHSFYIEFGGARYTWLITATTDWHWERLTNTDRKGVSTLVVASFAAPGERTLKVLEREDDARLDELVITNDPLFVPIDHCHRH